MPATESPIEIDAINKVGAPSRDEIVWDHCMVALAGHLPQQTARILEAGLGRNRLGIG
jgi:hypothetical protein